MTIRTFRTEFPSFDPATLPAIPAGWTDISYRNDACPSFLAASGLDWDLIVFVDFADPADRDFGEDLPRFAVEDTAGIGDDRRPLASDDWTSVVSYVAALAESRRAVAALAASRQQKGA